MTLDTSLGTHDGTIAMYQLLSMANPGSALTVRFSVSLTEELKPTLLASRPTLLTSTTAVFPFSAKSNRNPTSPSLPLSDSLSPSEARAHASSAIR